MLQKIKLKNFRKFANAEINLADGITLINGANGVGKSTILEAIEWGFYNKVRKDTILSSIRNKNHPDEEVSVVLYFTFNNEKYKLERMLTAKNSTTAVIVNADDENIIYAKGTTGVNNFVTKLFGIGHQAFTTSFMAKQKEIDSLGSLTNESRKQFFIKLLGLEVLDKIKPEIRRDIRGANQTLTVLRKQLPVISDIVNNINVDKKEVVNLKSKKEKIEKEIEKLTATVEELNTKRESGEKNYRLHLGLTEKLSTVEKSLVDTKDELKENKKKLSDLDSGDAPIINLDEINKTITKIENERDGYRRLAQFEDSFRELKTKKKALQLDIEMKNTQRSELETQIKSNGEDPKELEQLYQRKVNYLSQLKAKVAILIEQKDEAIRLLENVEGGVVVQCPTCYSDLVNNENAKMHISKEIKKHKKELIAEQFKITTLEQEVAELKEKIIQEQDTQRVYDIIRGKINTNIALTKNLLEQVVEVENQIKVIEKKTGETKIDSFTCKTLFEAEQKLNELKLTREKGTKLLAQVNESKHLAETITKNEKLITQLKEQKVNLEDKIKELGFNEKQHQKILQKIAEINDNINGQKEERIKLLADVRIIENNISSQEKELKKARDIEAQVNEHKTDIEITTVIDEIMTELRLDLAGRITPKIGEYTSNFLREITDGLYQNIILDDNYNIKILVDDEEWPLSQLSGGEQDVINLCMRLAISQIILEAKGIPYNMIILDEIFGSQDDERKMAIVDVISKLKAIFPQIILITHINEVKDKADHIISIEKNEIGDSVVK